MLKQPHSWWGNFRPGEKARIEMIQVLQKQPPSLAEKVEKMPGKMLVVAKAERTSRGGGELGTWEEAPGESQNLFALDFAPVVLLQRPGKTQRGVN